MQFLSRQFQKLHRQPRAILQTGVYGLCAGVAAVAFQWGINCVYHATFIRLAHRSKGEFLIGSFLLIVLSSLVVGWLLTRFCNEAAGSGIPQLKLAFWKDFGFVSWRAVWVKFVAGIISIGGGSSLGREGPSVHFGGGLASTVAGALGEAKQNRRGAAAAGAAAGLAAAFNTPIAAVTFVLEEIIEDFNSRLLGGVLLAAVIGAFVVHGLVGKQPAFSMAEVDPSSWFVYVLVSVVAALASLIGLLFQRSSIDLRARAKKLHGIPAWSRPALGGIITWALAVTVFFVTGSLGVFSLGYDDLSSALMGGFDWKVAGILLAAKLVATVACYGFGGCGGIFSPTLFFGGMCGIFLGGLVSLGDSHLTSADHIVLAVVGMSTCLGAVVRAPITGILIIFEMTHNFALVPALMLGALVSQAVSRRFSKHNFYEAILLQDGHHLQHLIPPKDLSSWQQLPVSAIANFQPVILENLEEGGLKETLGKFPYAIFPVTKDGKLIGMLNRQEILAAISERRTPKLLPGVTCLPNETIGDMQRLLIESATHVVIILDRPEGKVVGLITLHDLLRAEILFSKE